MIRLFKKSKKLRIPIETFPESPRNDTVDALEQALDHVAVSLSRNEQDRWFSSNEYEQNPHMIDQIRLADLAISRLGVSDGLTRHPRRIENMSEITDVIIMREYSGGRIIEGRCESADIRMGSLITPIGINSSPNIDLAIGNDLITGIVMGTAFPHDPLRNLDDFFSMNEWVRVYTGIDAQVYCYIEGQVIQIHTRRIFGRTYNDIVSELGIPRQSQIILDRQNLKAKKLIFEVPEFKINDLITIKLEKRKTNIYVNNVMFIQCKYLLINLESDKEYEEIESIDDAKKHLSNKMERNHSIIKPEDEYWGHCSNIQAWYENNYDLRIIHTNLGFPLLKRLCECGDKKALGTMKDEIFLRVEKGGYKAFKILESYMTFLTPEEIESIKQHAKPLPSQIIFDLFKCPEDYEYEVFAAGMSENNDVVSKGDFLFSLANIRAILTNREIEIEYIKIFSDIGTFHLAQDSNHFSTIIGLTEFEQMIKGDVIFWNHSRIIKHNILIFIVNDKFIFESGELSW